MATQKDVAERANVSFITVSRVINNKGNVKEETRQRVLQAIEELKYYPNAFGQGLTGNRMNTVAVLAPVPAHVGVEETSYYRRLLIGIEHCCVQAGYDLLLSAQRGTGDDFDFLRPYYERKADGLILMDVSPNNVHFPRIRDDDVPVVQVGNSSTSEWVSSVSSDNAAGTRAVTEYLIDQGHRHICYLHVDRPTQDTEDRLETFQRVLGEQGIQWSSGDILYGDFSKEAGRETLRQVLGMAPRPTALVSCTDLMALGVVEEAQRQGVRIPEDLSVVGFDGHEVATHANPPLATVVQDLEGMGFAAAELLLHKLSGDRVSDSHVVFPVSFEPRGSIAPPKE